MNKPKRKTPTPRKGEKAPSAPRRAREIPSLEDLGEYVSNRQVDPWRGQLMQLSWEYV